MKAAIYNFQCWLKETDPQCLEQALGTLLDAAGFVTLNQTDHHFQPQGYTGVWLLSESHLAIHTFPEDGKTYLELSSCNQAKNEIFVDLLRRSEML
ncbi:MAG: S-adenosylmethionine decarboxylase [Bacteroidota bacterium]